MRGRTRDRHLSDRRIPARPGRGAVGAGGLDTARRLPVPRRRLPRADAGRASHRTPVAAQPDRLDPPAGSAPPLPPAAAEQVVGAAWSFQSEAATLPLLFVWPVAVALVFPTGHLLSRRWRWVVAIGVVSFGATIGLKLFDPEPYPPPNDDIRNPVLGNGFGQFIVDTGIWIPFGLGVIATLFAGALAVILRFRRSVGVERLQMLWLVWGAALDAARPRARDRHEHVVRRRRHRDVLAPPRRSVCTRDRDRDRGRALPPVRDRAAGQPHARLRVADAPSRRRVCGDHDRVRRPGRGRFRVGRRPRDGRRCARVPPSALAYPGSRRPPLPAGPVRGGPAAFAAFEDEVRDGAACPRGDRRGPRGRAAGSTRGDLTSGYRRPRRTRTRPASACTSFRATSERAARDPA